MMQTSFEPRQHRTLLIVASVLYGLALPFLVLGAMMAPMASDAGVNGTVWTFIIAMMTWPLAILVGVVLGWVFFAIRWPRAVPICLAVPLLWLIPILLSLDFGR